MKILLKIFRILLISFGIIISIFNIFLIVGNIHTYIHRNDWKNRTTPLSMSTIDTLCANFELTDDNPLCDGERSIYSRDFFTVIRADFRPYEHRDDTNGTATYTEVQEKIGIFLIYCEPVATDAHGISSYTCDYDLRGDRTFLMGIIYTYPDNLVFRIMTPMGEDS
jgi:hypothetical protein